MNSIGIIRVLARMAIAAGSTMLVRSAHAAPEDHFVSTWKTDNPGTSSPTSIAIPTTGGGYNYDVDWNNDGTFDQFGITGSVTHDFGAPGSYTIRIQGAFPRIFFNNSGDRLKITSIDQWGTIAWSNMTNAFNGASNLSIPAADTPNFNAVTGMSAMFLGASIANPNTTNWNTSNVTSMSNMFRFATAANPDTSNWDVSKVTTMQGMFYEADSANPDTSNWNTSNVTTMQAMFYGADLANPDTSNWNTSNVTNMTNMFFWAPQANPNTSGWDTSKVTTMNGMFNGATTADPDTSNWNTSSVTDMQTLFYGATAANPDTTNWDTGNVTTFYRMFHSATSASPDTSNWDTSNVTNMQGMFAGATSANPDTSNWDTSKVTNMINMFLNATTANPDTSGWNTSSVVDMTSIFDGALSANPNTSNWDTSKVISFYRSFAAAPLANPDTSNWDTSSATTMQGMFSGAASADPDTSNWNTSSVSVLQNMFFNASAANPDVENWDISHVTNAAGMFEGASSFQRDLSGWNVSNISNLSNFLSGATLTTAQYNSLLTSWSVQPLPLGIGFHGGDSKYCGTSTSRSMLVSTFGRTVLDGGESCPLLNSPTNGRPVMGMAEPGLSVTLTTPSGATCTTMADAAGNYSCVLSPAPQDSESITLTQVDANGGAVVRAWTGAIDTIAPTVPTIITPTTGSPVAGVAEPGATVSLSTPSGASCTTIADASGNYSCTLLPAPIDGENIISIVTDAAGNSTSTSVTGAIRLPSTPRTGGGGAAAPLINYAAQIPKGTLSTTNLTSLGSDHGIALAEPQEGDAKARQGNQTILGSDANSELPMQRHLALCTFPARRFDYVDIDQSTGSRYIADLASKGIIDGVNVGPHLFPHAEPAREITRGEMLKLTLRTFCYDYASLPGETEFDDVQDGSWHGKVAQMAVTLGVLAENEEFAPDRSISFAEALKVVISVGATREALFQIDDATKGELENWHAKYFRKASDLELTPPDIQDLFPERPITRTEAAAFLSISLGKWNGWQ